MTETAVGVGLEGRFPRLALAVGRSRMMAVIVVADVLGGDPLLMQAIGARRCPDGLERQYQDQEEEEEASDHGSCSREQSVGRSVAMQVTGLRDLMQGADMFGRALLDL